MTTLTFDTLDAARSLRNAGVDEKTAEAIVSVVQRTTSLPEVGHLATKDQVDSFKTIVSAEFKSVNGRIDDLRTVLFLLFATNIAGFLGTAAFLYTVLKH